MKSPTLIHFENTRRAHHRRFFLPGGEPFSAISVDVDTREPLPVTIKDRHLPVAVLAPLVAMQAGRRAPGGLVRGWLALALLRIIFLHVSTPQSVGIVAAQTDLLDYRNFKVLAQVTS
jgi:hypothetical protein